MRQNELLTRHPKYAILREALAAAPAAPTRENFMRLFWVSGLALSQGNGLVGPQIDLCFDEVFGKSNPEV